MSVLWRYLRPQRHLVTLALLLAGAGQIMALYDPLIFGQIIDRFRQHPLLHRMGKVKKV